jgi:hypothetical protein
MGQLSDSADAAQGAATGSRRPLINTRGLRQDSADRGMILRFGRRLRYLARYINGYRCHSTRGVPYCAA